MKTTLLIPSNLMLLSLLLASVGTAQADELIKPEKGKKIKVFVLAGQSNMEGRADGNKLTVQDKKRLKNVQSHVQLAFNHEPVQPLGVVKPSREIAEIYQREYIFGPELFFGMALAETWTEERILLIKLAAGSTSLHGCWNPIWHQDKAAIMDEQHEPKLYRALIAYIKQVLSGFEDEEYEICAFLWVQGETDAGNKTAAAEYGNNLRNLVVRLRRDLGEASLPVMLFQVGRGKVVLGMKQVASDLPYVSLIPQSANPESPNYYPKMKNGHYNYEGMKKLGSRFARLFLEQSVLKQDADGVRVQNQSQ